MEIAALFPKICTSPVKFLPSHILDSGLLPTFHWVFQAKTQNCSW
jgi:hypothetical protein